MNRRIQINPLVTLAGIAALGAALAATQQQDAAPAPAAAGNQASPAVAAAVGKTLVGPSVSMGDGSIHAFVRLDAAGDPESVGVTFPEAALNNLPANAGRTCCDGPEFALALPAGTPASLPFTHVVVNWNPKGHEPAGVYDKPHFDFHFYIQSPEDRQAITAEGADLARCTKPLAPECTPTGYVPAPGGIPRMGAHWIFAATPELHGQPFTKTFIYGSYDGRLTFVEPMITKAYLETRPDFAEPLPQPKVFPAPGYYPTAYSIRFDPQTHQYTVSLDRLTRRE